VVVVDEGGSLQRRNDREGRARKLRDKRPQGRYLAMQPSSRCPAAELAVAQAVAVL
jgi:hypothetical protein